MAVLYSASWAPGWPSRQASRLGVLLGVLLGVWLVAVLRVGEGVLLGVGLAFSVGVAVRGRGVGVLEGVSVGVRVALGTGRLASWVWMTSATRGWGQVCTAVCCGPVAMRWALSAWKPAKSTTIRPHNSATAARRTVHLKSMMGGRARLHVDR